MNNLYSEFRLTLRRIWRRPLHHGLLLITFISCIGMALYCFVIYNTVFFRQPDYDRKGEFWVLTNDGSLVVDGNHFSLNEMEAYGEARHLFDDFAPVALYSSINLEGQSGSERRLGAFLSSRALSITNVRPIIGGLFSSEDDRARAPTKVLIGEHLWETMFGRDPNVIGKSIGIDGDRATIIGVLPASYRFPNSQELWISYGAAPDNAKYSIRQALVKLRRGVTRRQAESELRRILIVLGPNSPANIKRLTPCLVPFRELFFPADMRKSANILLAAAVVFVVFSCLNATNLVLVDYLSRRGDTATILALGIPNLVPIRWLFTQVAVIAGLSALLALMFLPISGPLLFDRIKIINAPYWFNYQFDWSYVLFALFLACLATVSTVIIPSSYSILRQPENILRGLSGSNRGSARAPWRKVLLTGQIGLLTALCVIAAFLVRSSNRTAATGWGYPANDVFMGKLTNASLSYPGNEIRYKRLMLHRSALEYILQRPSTESAAFAENPPGYGNGPFCKLALDPASFESRTFLLDAFWSRVTEQYFEVLRVPFLDGKMFPLVKSVGATPYAIITSSLAKKLWKDESAIDKVLYVRYPWMRDDVPPMRLVICGVARDFYANGPTGKTNDALFTPFVPESGAPGNVFLLVRDRRGLPSSSSLSEAVHKAHPQIMLYFPSTIGEQIKLILSPLTMVRDLTTFFALAAALIGALGVYSLASAQIAQHLREFGIRLALGAQPHQVWVSFTKSYMLSSAIGIGLGSAIGYQAMQVVGALVYGTESDSFSIYFGVGSGVMLITGIACLPSLFKLRQVNPAECARSI